jgi:peptidyl-prolyl cis-trans isomerase C
VRAHRALVTVATLVTAAAACDGKGTSQAGGERGANVALGGEIASRVGDETIPLELVRAVARAQGLDAHAAARRAVDDALLATAAHAQGLDQRQPTAWRLLAARARVLTDRTLDEAKRRGLPDDGEVNTLSRRHWLEVDRPPSVRTIHAVVLAPKDRALVPAARALAERVRAAVVSQDNGAFEALASSAREGAGAPTGLDLRVESLPAFTEEGLVVEGGGSMDSVFAKAAYALRESGATSEVVETRFGFHVIRLLERLPENRMPFEQRRLAFAEEVYSLRAHDLLTRRLESLRAAHPVEVSGAAETLMRAASVVVTATSAGP